MIDELMLLKGHDYKLKNKVTIKHPTLQEIYDFGEEEYYKIVHIFTCQPYEYMVYLDDVGIDYETIDAYDLFIMLYNSGMYLNGLKWLMDIDDFILSQYVKNGMVCLFSKKKDFVLDKFIYYQISEYLQKINFVNIKSQYNPANSITKKKIIEQERKKLKRQKNKEFKSILKSKISALVWGNTSGISLKNVWDLYIYQMYDGLYRLNKIKNYNNVMNGYYFGTVDIKKVNMDEINWLSEI